MEPAADVLLPRHDFSFISFNIHYLEDLTKRLGIPWPEELLVGSVFLGRLKALSTWLHLGHCFASQDVESGELFTSPAKLVTGHNTPKSTFKVPICCW